MNTNKNIPATNPLNKQDSMEVTLCLISIFCGATFLAFMPFDLFFNIMDKVFYYGFFGWLLA
jgi:hypothetical protein